MNNRLYSYPKIWNFGHPQVKEIFLDNVIVEEKIDGSQFSFCIINNEIKCKSKRVELNTDAPEKLFNKAVNTVRSIQHLLRDGWIYRCEYLEKPKHNTLVYDRIPKDHLIIYDINPSEESYLSPEEKTLEASRLGLETVPLLFAGKIDNIIQIHSLMDRISLLGGQKIEGLVIKNYFRFGMDSKVLMAKHVSEEFKECNSSNWKETNPNRSDVLETLINRYKSIPRWNKAIQHLQEEGKLTNSPKDIGLLVHEAQQDIKEECSEEIKEALYKWAIDKILRGSIAGMPEWYKNKLLEAQFKTNE